MCLLSTVLVLNLVCFAKLSTSQHKWKLFWKYEFDSKQLDQNQWLVENEPDHLCTGEYMGQDSCHSSQNVQVNTEKRRLEISVTKNPKVSESGKTYYSGKLKTIQSWTYGKFEIRAILPEGKLLRPAFLMVPKSYSYKGDWIDNGWICGLVYAQKTGSIISRVYHRKDQRNCFGDQLKTIAPLTKEFHRYSIEWCPQAINWYFDDSLYLTYNVSKPFDQPFRIVLQLGVGGPEFGNQTLSEEDYKNWQNNKFIIDYVKVFKNKSELRNSSTINLSEWLTVLLNLSIVLKINILFK